MSASASVLGPPARPVLAWLADVPAVTRNTRARGRTTAATVVAASHLSTGCSQGHVPEVPPGAVIARCAARANGTRDQPVDVKSRHWRLVVISRKPLSTVVRQGKRTASRPAARTRRQRRVRSGAGHVVNSRHQTTSTHPPAAPGRPAVRIQPGYARPSPPANAFVTGCAARPRALASVH